MSAREIRILAVRNARISRRRRKAYENIIARLFGRDEAKAFSERLGAACRTEYLTAVDGGRPTWCRTGTALWWHAEYTLPLHPFCRCTVHGGAP